MAEADEGEDIDYYAVLNVRKEVNTVLIQSLKLQMYFYCNQVQQYYISG